MTQRYTYKFLKAYAKRTCDAASLDYGAAYEKQADGTHKAVIGRVFLEHNTYYGYALCQIVNEGGGQRNLANGMSGKEMVAFLDGMRAVAERK